MESDLISKKALVSFIDKTAVPELLLQGNYRAAGVMAGLSRALEETNKFQVVDAAETVHAEWEHIGGDEWRCTKCCLVITTEGSWEKPWYRHCPNCGARIKRGEEDAE